MLTTKKQYLPTPFFPDNKEKQSIQIFKFITI